MQKSVVTPKEARKILKKTLTKVISPRALKNVAKSSQEIPQSYYGGSNSLAILVPPHEQKSIETELIRAHRDVEAAKTTKASDGAQMINTLQDPENNMEDNDPKKEKQLLKDQDILVVDDSSDNRLLISHFLKSAGANVDCAVDGFDGVTKALEKKYKLVLMDIQMPQLDGYEATARLRQQGYNRPIIALTAHAMKQEQERSLNAGCDGHLTKPIDRRTLVQQVNKYIMSAQV